MRLMLKKLKELGYSYYPALISKVYLFKANYVDFKS